MAVDLELVDDLDLLEANDPPESSQTLRREAPVHELIARVHLAGLVNLDRRAVSLDYRRRGVCSLVPLRRWVARSG